MKRIGLLSDTHSYLDEQIFHYFEECDEIWHAGDIGSMELMDQLEAFKPVRAVHGNIDDHKMRLRYPEEQRFLCEDLDVWMIHIGGYPGRYVKKVRERMPTNSPDLFICGHSHILKVMPDKKHDLIHMNPGACGNHGFHKIKTMLRFSVEGTQIFDLEAVELGLRGVLK